MRKAKRKIKRKAKRTKRRTTVSSIPLVQQTPKGESVVTEYEDGRKILRAGLQPGAEALGAFREAVSKADGSLKILLRTFQIPRSIRLIKQSGEVSGEWTPDTAFKHINWL